MFQPRIGARWGEAGNMLNGARLLVLGESHYDGETGRIGAHDPGMTGYVVEALALKGPNRFFTNITQLVAGRRKSGMTPEEIRAVWDALMFYNYVPVIAASGPGQAPTDRMFEDGREPFLRLLDEHDPEAILVCGHRLWGHLLRGVPDHLKNHAYDQPFRRIGRAVAARMKHPGWAFNSFEQRPLF